MNSFILILAFCITIIASLVNVFSLHFSILVSPIIVLFLFIPFLLLGFVLAALCIYQNKTKKNYHYIPIFILSISIILNSFLNSGIWLHYFTNKNNLETIIKECSELNIYNLDDRSLFDASRLDIKDKFLEKLNIYKNEDKSHINKVYEIQQKMKKVGVYSIYIKDGYNVFIIDGFLDNTYGYIKSTNYKITINDIIPPYYDKVVRLIELNNGWYFFYTT